MKNDPLLLLFKAELYRQSFDTINTLCTEGFFFPLPPSVAYQLDHEMN